MPNQSLTANGTLSTITPSPKSSPSSSKYGSPGQVVFTPTAEEKNTAHYLLLDLAAIPTEHGLCTFRSSSGVNREWKPVLVVLSSLATGGAVKSGTTASEGP